MSYPKLRRVGDAAEHSAHGRPRQGGISAYVWLDYEQSPRNPRRNGLPVKRREGSLLMGHEHVARALLELRQSRQTASGTDPLLPHAPKAFEGGEVVPTMGR